MLKYLHLSKKKFNFTDYYYNNYFINKDNNKDIIASHSVDSNVCFFHESRV